MRRPSLRVPGFVALSLLAAGPARTAPDTPVVALFPTQNRAGDAAATAGVDRALQLELGQHARVIDPVATRDALRRLRIRNGDGAAPALLRLLGEQLGADWLVSSALHDADRRLVPRLTLSTRTYSSATGQLRWAGFQAASGLDRRSVLGLGRIGSVEVLAPIVVRDLLRELPANLAGATGPSVPGERASKVVPGRVAIVPFGGSTKWRATANAETVTEAARARLFSEGVQLVSPNTSHEILRRVQAGRWGGVTSDTRAALHGSGGADAILTGAVEAYDVGGSEFEPEPRVAIAMRLLDAATGRILWTGALEREGWDGLRLLGLGKIHSRGVLADRMIESLTRDLAKENVQPTRRPEGKR